MLLSQSHEFIFIHIPKVAGVSIEEFFLKYAVKNRGPNGEKFIQHSTARKIKAGLSPRVYDKYYKFAFVRNPWDRWVSLYFFILHKDTHVEHLRVKSFKDFDEFVEDSIERGRTQQKNTLTDNNGKFIVDYIGRFETLSDDINHLCRILDIKNTSFPYMNRSRHRDYRSYYNERTKEMVAGHFKDDIRLFGYTFDVLKKDAKRMVTGGELSG